MTRNVAVPVALFVGVWLCYMPGNMGCSDSMWSIPTAISLLDHGDADLDEYLPVLEARRFVLTQQIGAHRYTIYPLGASILAIPGVLVLRPVAAAVKRSAPEWWRSLEAVQAKRGCAAVAGEPIVTLHSWTEHLIASAMVAATAVVIYFLALGEVSVIGAAALALLFAFGTSAWSTASRSLWQHGPSMLLIALSLLLQRGPAGRPFQPSTDAIRFFLVGLLLAFAYVVRPTNLIVLVIAAAWTAWVSLSRPRRFPAFLAGAAVALTPFVLSNLSIHGDWLPPYYRPGFYSRNSFIGEALAGNLVSPNRGLFVYSPVFLLSLAGMALKTRRLTTLDLSLAACLLAHWVAISAANGNWWGGHSYGPRFFTDLLPYLIYFLIPVVAWIESAPARGVRRRVTAEALSVTAAMSVAMHAQGALNAAAPAWNGYPANIDLEPARVWDWRQPQFLAGVTFTPTPRPPVNLDAIPCTEPPGMPGAPAVSSIDGSTVVLRWTPAPGAVAVYLADVGYRPGTKDLPTREVRDVANPTLVAERVPRGTYYVSVRARNRCGDGPASPEIAVTVP